MAYVSQAYGHSAAHGMPTSLGYVRLDARQGMSSAGSTPAASGAPASGPRSASGSRQAISTAPQVAGPPVTKPRRELGKVVKVDSQQRKTPASQPEEKSPRKKEKAKKGTAAKSKQSKVSPAVAASSVARNPSKDTKAGQASPKPSSKPIKPSVAPPKPSSALAIQDQEAEMITGEAPRSVAQKRPASQLGGKVVRSTGAKPTLEAQQELVPATGHRMVPAVPVRSRRAKGLKKKM